MSPMHGCHTFYYKTIIYQAFTIHHIPDCNYGIASSLTRKMH